jgi:hypothetical protein
MNLIHRLQAYDNPNSLSSRFRAARRVKIVELIEATHAAAGQCRILDLGGRPDYWGHFDRAMLERCGVHITLVNPEAIDAGDDPMFTAMDGDACNLDQWADNAFDMTHSNSVVEHVGDWARMAAFAAESRRLAPRYYAQTPYFWFPVEPHFSAPFFHWRSEQTRARILMKRGMGFSERAPDVGKAMADVQHARLLDKNQFRFLFPDAKYADEQVAGLTKSLVAIRS